MQGIVFDIKRFALHDGPGTRTTVFMKGCPLNCWWCHNPESIQPEIEEFTVEERLGSESFSRLKKIGEYLSLEQVIAQIKKEQVFMDESGGGATLSGGEPLLQLEFTKALLKKCKSQGIHTALDTTGLTSQNKLEELLPYVDLFLYDFKLMDSKKHETYCGVSNSLIKSNLEFLVEKEKVVVVRIPVIPKINFENTEEEDMLKYLTSIKKNNFNEVHLLPYHKIGKSKYTRFQKKDKLLDAKELTKSDLESLSLKYKEAGFKIVVH